MHQLLGLRLRFRRCGKYSDVFNFIFQINFVDLFWSVFAAATECKRANVSVNAKKIRKKSRYIFLLKIIPVLGIIYIFVKKVESNRKKNIERILGSSCRL